MIAALKTIVNFISGLINFVWMIINGIIQLVTILVQAVVGIGSYAAYLPAVLSSLVIGLVSIAVILKVLGRDN